MPDDEAKFKARTPTNVQRILALEIENELLRKRVKHLETEIEYIRYTLDKMKHR